MDSIRIELLIWFENNCHLLVVGVVAAVIVVELDIGVVVAVNGSGAVPTVAFVAWRMVVTPDVGVPEFDVDAIAFALQQYR